MQYALLFGLVLAISAGLRPRDLLALRSPLSWRRALGIALAVLVAILALTSGLEPLLGAGAEQGLTPDRWEPDRAGAFAVNFAVVAGLGPAVEELTYRGLGYTLLTRLGVPAAVLGTGVAFALAHGLVRAVPILFAFGLGLAYLRLRTRSVYPCIVLHAVFNAIALVAAVTI